jgi:hypothetical protein
MEVLVKLLSSFSSVLRVLILAGGVIPVAASFIAAPSILSAGVPVQDNSAASTQTPAISGNWQLSWTTAKGKQQQVTVEIKQDGKKLSGTFQSARGSAPLKGNAQGNQVSFSTKAKKGEVSFTGNVDGDKMSGTTDQGTSWTATRQN